MLTTSLKGIRNIKKVGDLPAVIISLSEYENMREDLDVLHSKTLERSIEKTRKEIKEGGVISLKEIKKRLKIK
ncbi:MAG TPA: hypothetical protein VJH67_02675 [Candidatus Paceibacterota bacterium]